MLPERSLSARWKYISRYISIFLDICYLDISAYIIWIYLLISAYICLYLQIHLYTSGSGFKPPCIERRVKAKPENLLVVMSRQKLHIWAKLPQSEKLDNVKCRSSAVTKLMTVQCLRNDFMNLRWIRWLHCTVRWIQVVHSPDIIFWCAGGKALLLLEAFYQNCAVDLA